MNTVTLAGKTTQLEGVFPKVGQKAPDFTLVDADLKDQNLKHFSEKRKLLLIVPSIETSVCATCTKKFHDKVKTLSNLSLLVISADLPFAQKRYYETEKLSNLTALSMMRDKSFAKDYGVLINSGPLKGLCSRAVLVLDENNVVIYSELVSEITNEPDYEKALKV